MDRTLYKGLRNLAYNKGDYLSEYSYCGGRGKVHRRYTDTVHTCENTRCLCDKAYSRAYFHNSVTDVVVGVCSMCAYILIFKNNRICQSCDTLSLNEGFEFCRDCRDETVGYGRYANRTYSWVFEHDVKYCTRVLSLTPTSKFAEWLKKRGFKLPDPVFVDTKENVVIPKSKGNRRIAILKGEFPVKLRYRAKAL